MIFVPLLVLLFRFVVDERIGTVVLSALVAHTGWHWMLDRYGVLIRGAVAAERVPSGFGALYPVLRAMEESGQCRRGYFVEGLGAAQFALTGAVDRMRAMTEAVTGPVAEADADPSVVVLAAADPANAYGAALPWPPR